MKPLETMIIKLIRPSRINTVHTELPNPNMIVDPRPIGYAEKAIFEFRADVQGTLLKMTRIQRLDRGWLSDLFFRVYNSNEKFYSIENSTSYIYHGLQNERAPFDTTEVFVKEGVESIRSSAFASCAALAKVTISDSVRSIEDGAFGWCTSLRTVLLSLNLAVIGNYAFYYCTALESIYIPPSVEDIGHQAFADCKSLRIINIPASRIGKGLLLGCDKLLIGEMQNEILEGRERSCDKWVKNRLNPLQSLCSSPYVTAKCIKTEIKVTVGVALLTGTFSYDEQPFTPVHSNRSSRNMVSADYSPVANSRKRTESSNPTNYKIRKRFGRMSSLFEDDLRILHTIASQVGGIIDDGARMTAFHLLMGNPYLKGGMVTAFLKSIPQAATVQDSEGQTPLHIFCSSLFSRRCLNDAKIVLRAYLRNPNGKEAAFMQDAYGQTPLDYICREQNKNMPLLESNGFAELFVWWFMECLGLELFGSYLKIKHC